MQIAMWPIERLKPYPRNARIISPEAVEKVALSLQRFGWRQPIVADENGIILAGHTRLLAAQKLGQDRVPVHQASDLTPVEKKSYRLMDNRSHEESKWHASLLHLELADLRDSVDFDLDLTGFTLDEFRSFHPPASDRFSEVDEMIEIQHICPRCQYRFSHGKTALSDPIPG